MPRLEVVDSHFHLWWLKKFQYAWPDASEELKKVYRDFLPTDYESELAGTPIKHAVFIEVHESLEETKWLLQVAEKHNFIKGVVGYTDMTSSNFEANIIELKKHPKFVGIRKILDFSEDNWIERDDVIGGMKVLARHNLTFDLLIRSRSQHESAKRFLNRISSNLKVVIDHLGKPNAKRGAEPEWYDDIKTMAGHKNVYCKLSGMVTEGNWENWKSSDFQAHVDHVIKHFGIDRVMFGSDWPVCKLANANLPDVFNLLSDLLKDLSEEERRKVFVENGRNFYNLSL